MQDLNPSLVDLEPEEISYGTCQGLRVIRVGAVYLIQQLNTAGDGAEKCFQWKTLAKSDSGPNGEDDARADAIVTLNNMNERVTAMIRQNVEKMQ